MANHARPVELTDQQKRELRRLERSHTAPAGLSRRARAILLLARNVTGVEVAQMTGYTPVQVSRIRRRFAEHGLEGLVDRPRSGRPKEITQRKISQVVALTLKAPPAGITHWSAREMAQRTGLSHSTVHRIWQAHNLRPHQLQTFKFTTDPDAEQKILDVVGLYLNPPDNAVVLSLDEKTQIQALSRTQPILPLRENLPARMTHDYRRNGLTSLFAALEIATGRVVGECRARHTSADFLSFIKRVARTYRRGELHIILDNSSTHSTPAVRAWLDDHPRVHFHFTPKGASWMNMVEAWFSVLTRKSIRRGSFNTVRALVRHIGQYISRWNEDPTPFVWTKSADTIIEKAIRP